ncbi:hypothetical protein SDC9_138630 [bioreactor metagenome]|uniref:Uncharacterized protein n=1 Tax=bioreactor metagenome TaxID=1076179 RepID=A0A645DQH0_9ZZZZ
MSKSKINYLLIVIGVVILTAFIVRFVSPEDSWVCQKGEWVAHGSPAAEKPTGTCEIK